MKKDPNPEKSEIVQFVGKYTGKSVVDSEGRELFSFVMSTRELDRDFEIIDTHTLKLDNFLKNPVLLYMHERECSVVGQWYNVKLEGDDLIGDAYFHELPEPMTGEKISSRVKLLVKNKFLRACSIGYPWIQPLIIPVDINNAITLPDGTVIQLEVDIAEQIKNSWRRGVAFYQNADLLEASIVDLPSNTNSLAKQYKDILAKLGAEISATNKDKIINAIENIKTAIDSLKTHQKDCHKALVNATDCLKGMGEGMGEGMSMLDEGNEPMDNIDTASKSYDIETKNIIVCTEGFSNAKSLISKGKYDLDSAWTITEAEKDDILGDPADYKEYSKWFLAEDDSVTDDTKGRFKYPFGKNGKVFYKGLTAIRKRAGQQKETDIFDRAGTLIDLINEKEKKMYEDTIRNSQDTIKNLEKELTETKSKLSLLKLQSLI